MNEFIPAVVITAVALGIALWGTIEPRKAPKWKRTATPVRRSLGGYLAPRTTSDAMPTVPAGPAQSGRTRAPGTGSTSSTKRPGAPGRRPSMAQPGRYRSSGLASRPIDRRSGS